jgi:hypothetical protein
MITRRSLLTAAGSSLIVQMILPLRTIGESVPATLDHIILGCSDLDAGIEFMEQKSGYRAARGGSHLGRGTRNALLALGGQRYLEILAPDPEQNGLAWHKEIAQLTEPILVGWAVRSKDVTAYTARLRARGVECIGPILAHERGLMAKFSAGKCSSLRTTNPAFVRSTSSGTSTHGTPHRMHLVPVFLLTFTPVAI